MTKSPPSRPPKEPSATPSAAQAAPMSSPPSLVEAQELFQAAILAGDTRILDALCDNSHTTRDTLFGVYRQGYAARLVEIVANDFEAVAAYCGEDAFEALAEAYVLANPSHTQNARYFTAAFPEFLRRAPDTAGRPEIAELADIEKALSDAFDAPDAPALTLAGLAAHPAEQWGRLVFVPHPSARLQPLATNAFDIWQALVAETDAPPPAAQACAAHDILIWRQDLQAMARALEAEESMLWREVLSGRPFDALCEILATYDDAASAPQRAAGYLQAWLNDGVLTRAHVVQKTTSAARARR